jgi:hypothetical protein
MLEERGQKLKAYLEVTTNIAVILVAVLVLGTFAWNFYRARQGKTVLESGLLKNKVLSPVTGLNYSESPQTVLIAMNTQCRYCSESTAFYNRLAEFQGTRKGAVRIIAVFPNSANEVRDYVSRTGLVVDTIAATDLDRLNVAGTPTIILVDGLGKVVDFWVGKLTTDSEDEVLRRLSA